MTEYCKAMEVLEKKLGGKCALARSLGISPKTLRHRVANPHTIKPEHKLALEALLWRLR